MKAYQTKTYAPGVVALENITFQGLQSDETRQLHAEITRQMVQSKKKAGERTFEFNLESSINGRRSSVQFVWKSDTAAVVTCARSGKVGGIPQLDAISVLLTRLEPAVEHQMLDQVMADPRLAKIDPACFEGAKNAPYPLAATFFTNGTAAKDSLINSTIKIAASVFFGQFGIPGMETDPTTGQTLGPDHPLTLGRCYYIVPAKLLEPALSAMGRDHLDQNIVELDRTLAGTMEAVPTLVGLWDRRPIHHELLNVRPPPSSDAFDQATLRWLGWESVTTVDKVRLALAEADDSLDRLRRSRRAYCGWLVCNRQFVLEQSALWREWQGQLRQYGIPVMGPAVADPASGIDAQKAQAPLGPLLQAFEAFLRRWELAQLSGPRLPVPFSPQWPALGPQSQPGHADSAVQQFSVPRTIPLIPADQMQQVLEDAIARPSAGSHLQDWMSIVAKDNSAKQTIGRYARLFQLQHYWRVLHSRYGPACTRRDGKLKSVFAEFLGVTDETVHVDLQLLRRRLGADWCRQGQP